MAEYGEWNRKGATLSDITARKEYGITRDFIIDGIRKGKLECREISLWGNPGLRILRSQLEHHIIDQLGHAHLATEGARTELRKIEKEIAHARSKLALLEARKAAIECAGAKAKRTVKRPA